MALTALCLTMRSHFLGVIRGLRGVVTCVYGPAVTYAFSHSLIAGYRHSVIHVSSISVLDGTALNWRKQEHLRTRRSEAALFRKLRIPIYLYRNSEDSYSAAWADTDRAWLRLTQSSRTWTLLRSRLERLWECRPGRRLSSW